MADEKLGVLFYEIEARQKKLDDSLDEGERKTKKAGEKMEKNLSLGGAASGLIKIFAAVSAIETAFRAAEGVAQLFRGDVEGALDAAERIPLGIGSAVAAGRDFFEVISGSRQEAERIAEEFQKAAESIAAAQSNLQSLTEQNIRSGLGADGNRLRDVNLQNQETNRQLSEVTRIITQLQRFDAEQRSRGRFGGNFPGAGEGPLEGFGGTEALEALGVGGATTGDALRQLRDIQERLFKEGSARTLREEQRLNDQRLQRALDIEREVFLERLRDLNEFERERFRLRAEFDRRIARAQTETELDALRRLERERLRSIDARERRAGELEQERINREFERRQRLKRAESSIEARAEPPRESSFRLQALSVERFLRLAAGGGAGEQQAVEDRKVAALLKSLVDVARQIQQSTRVSTFGPGG